MVAAVLGHILLVDAMQVMCAAWLLAVGFFVANRLAHHRRQRRALWYASEVCVAVALGAVIVHFLP